MIFTRREAARAFAGTAIATVAAATWGPAGAAAASPGRAVRIGACGDIGDSASSGAGTARLIGRVKPSAFLPLGDLAYDDGTRQEMEEKYLPHFGKFRAITYATPGNHEHNTSNAAGFMATVARRGQTPNYSLSAGGWRLIAIDTERDVDAAANYIAAQRDRYPRAPFLMYSHKPALSSESHNGGETGPFKPLLRAAQQADVKLWLAGHSHVYERFAPIGGVRQIIAGTGGAGLRSFSGQETGSQKQLNKEHGVLFVDLAPVGYRWNFVGVSGKILDRGGTRITTASRTPVGATT